MNYTMNSDDLVPLVLVFDFLPRFPLTGTTIPVQQDCKNALRMVRQEMESIVSIHRFKKSSFSNVPFSSKYEFKLVKAQEDQFETRFHTLGVYTESELQKLL